MGHDDVLRNELRWKSAGRALVPSHVFDVRGKLGTSQALLPEPRGPGVGACVAGLSSLLYVAAPSARVPSFGLPAGRRRVRFQRIHAASAPALWIERRLRLDAARVLGRRRGG